MKYSAIIIASLLLGVALPEVNAQQDKTQLPAFFLAHELVQGQRVAHYYIDQQGKEIAELMLFEYTDDRLITCVDSTSLEDQLTTSSTFVVKHVLQTNTVHKLRIRYQDNSTFYTGYVTVDHLEFQPGSEFETSNYTISTNYGTPQIDRTFEGGQLQLNQIQAGRGFGVHATGNVEMRFPAGLYDRFTAYAGKQKNKNGNLGVSLKVDDVITYPLITFSPNNHYTFDQALALDATSIRIDVATGGDGNGADHGSICSPYFFMRESRATQQIDAPKHCEQVQVFTDTLTLVPDIETTAGLTSAYTILTGGEHAEVLGNRIFIHEVSALDTLVVQAFHPGDTQYQSSNPVLLKYVFFSTLDVPKNSTVTLQEGGNYEKITLHSDGLQTGKIALSQGVVTVDELEIKMKLNPAQWYHFSFPFEIDLQEESNLADLDFALNGEQGTPRFEIQEFSGAQKALDQASNGWIESSTTTLQANKGYLFRLANSLADEPVELVFLLDNQAMVLQQGPDIVGLSVDLGYAPTNSKQVVYVSPANVKGDMLRVEIDYQPSSLASLPMNYDQELKEARVTYTPNRQGIRITLPTQEVAKVAIFQAEDLSFVKAVNYVAPNLIDISNLSPGTYELVVRYGGALNTFKFEK